MNISAECEMVNFNVGNQEITIEFLLSVLTENKVLICIFLSVGYPTLSNAVRARISAS